MPDSTVEGIRTTFAKGEKVTPVTILHETEIGQGRFGIVTEADVLVHGKNRRFVIKRFKSTQTASPEENAATAMKNYYEAKRAGLRVFPTYRLGEDGKSILMTNANLPSFYCVDVYGKSSLPARGLPKLENVDDKVKLLTESVFQQARVAAERDVGLYVDAFFFLIDKETKDIDFVLGDLDMINDLRLPDYEGRLKGNLNNALGALTNFVNYNVEDPERYKARIKDMFFDAQMRFEPHKP